MRKRCWLGLGCGILAGGLAAALALLSGLHSLGAFEIRTRPLILVPIVDGRGPAGPPPVPTPTPTPEPTPTEEQRNRYHFEQRRGHGDEMLEAGTRARPSSPKLREWLVDLGADAREEIEMICPDCFRKDMAVLMVAGSIIAPTLSMTLIWDRSGTRMLRRFNGLSEADPWEPSR
jgi:hypothetical protein